MNNVTLTTSEAKSRSILDKGYTRRLTPDPAGGYTANILEFPGCFAEGETADEALHNLDAAAVSWINVSLAHGREIRDPVNFDGYSGKIALRIPRGLHQQVAELAELEECSVNQVLTTAIAQYVARADAFRVLERTVRETFQKLIPIKVVNVDKWQMAGSQFLRPISLVSNDYFGTTEALVFPLGEAKLVPVGTTVHG